MKTNETTLSYLAVHAKKENARDRIEFNQSNAIIFDLYMTKFDTARYFSSQLYENVDFSILKEFFRNSNQGIRIWMKLFCFSFFSAKWKLKIKLLEGKRWYRSETSVYGTWT